MTLPLPRPVNEGSRLGIVAPAGPFDEEAFRKGVDWLKTRYEVVHRPDIFTKEGYFAGTDERRKEELIDAITDPGIDAILCARGGFGSTRLLPGLDVATIEEANKLIVGFSDITALHTLWSRAGVRSVHAPMVAALGAASEPIREKWVAAVEKPDSPCEWNLTPLSRPENAEPVEGEFFGGNLAVLGALNGTPFAPELDGKILFLEDVGERPYRVDRMLTTLAQSGWWNRVEAIVLGSFTEGEPGTDGISIEDVFANHFADISIPVLAGLEAGHIRENEPLRFGAPACIHGNKLTLNP